MREYRYGMRCKEHNLMIHSYVSKPFSLLCNKCLEEISNFNLKVVPLPEVLEICRDSISKLKRNVEKLEQDSNKNEEESIETIKNDLEDYFTRIHKKVKDANGQAKETLLEKVKIFKEETKIQHKKCEEMISKTKINEQRLNYLLTLPLGNLLQEKEAVDNLYALSKESTSGLILSSFAVELQLKQDSLSVFKEFIKNSISIKLKKSSKEAWTCMKCNKNIVEGKIRCECGGFRSIESYQNIITNIYECSQVEISEIQQRREIEMNLINELDDSKENNLWYIINADWVSDWKNFVFNRPSRPGLILPDIGALPPGPINNNTLLKDNGEVKMKLKPAVHYRGVNKKVWEAYMFIYGGGPQIVRKTLNIYE